MAGCTFTVADLRLVEEWDWAEVERVAARLSRFIRELAVAKARTYVVLPAAARFYDEGGVLSANPGGRLPWPITERWG